MGRIIGSRDNELTLIRANARARHAGQRSFEVADELVHEGRAILSLQPDLVISNQNLHRFLTDSPIAVPGRNLP